MNETKKYVFAGFADEAAPDIATQIEVHEKQDWRHLEVRLVDGKNFCEIDDAAFEVAARKLEAAGMRIVCFGSAIANWARPVTHPFEKDASDLRRSIPRMRLFGTKFIRVMSYPNDPKAPLLEKDWRSEVFRRMKELAAIAEGEGIVLVHENCDGWGSKSPENLVALVEEIASPAFKIVFDTGNSVSHGGTGEETLRFYRAAKPHIVHFHIKDCRKGEDGKPVHVYPGEGESRVVEIVADLLASGYRGAFSIEPHMASQVHTGKGFAKDMDARGVYEEYMKRTEALFARLSS